jgi:predicted O-methyltransferase YrrM
VALENETREGATQQVEEAPGPIETPKETRMPETSEAATWVPPGHYYSPLVDPHDPHVHQLLEVYWESELPPDCGVAINDAEMLSRLDKLSKFYPDLPFSTEKSGTTRYHYENPAFGYGDAIVYSTMIRHLRPKRIIEVGSGYSSAVAMDTNDLFFDGRIELTFIEPYPDTFLSMLTTETDDRYRSSLVQSKLQDAPTSLFRTLKRNDILFIDSSHVAKMASDVNYYFQQILPLLAQGVVIHIHDIPYPFEYPPDWIRAENRSWNEAYLLFAFLQFNPNFRVTYFNHYMFRKHRQVIEEKMPLCLQNPGASIWLERIK